MDKGLDRHLWIGQLGGELLLPKVWLGQRQRRSESVRLVRDSPMLSLRVEEGPAFAACPEVGKDDHGAVRVALLGSSHIRKSYVHESDTYKHDCDITKLLAVSEAT